MIRDESLAGRDRLERELKEVHSRMVAVVEKARQSDYGQRAAQQAQQLLRHTRTPIRTNAPLSLAF